MKLCKSAVKQRSTRKHHMQLAKTKEIPNSFGRFTHITVLVNTSLAIYFACASARSTLESCTVPLRICKENCDWLGQTDVTEIASPARFRRRYFWWREATTGNTSAHAGYLGLGMDLFFFWNYTRYRLLISYL